ncbi:hypothetical protein BX600DRAFT_258241 [Xylariales sp. PMI_506]|nr:hypothetical protein BX600DRAFT_258241 [Xylariales sp. PMI_506]
MSSRGTHVDWNQWGWVEEYGYYYRTGRDRNGRILEEYRRPEEFDENGQLAQTGTGLNDQWARSSRTGNEAGVDTSIPRVGDITEGMEHLAMGPQDGYTVSEGYSHHGNSGQGGGNIHPAEWPSHPTHEHLPAGHGAAQERKSRLGKGGGKSHHSQSKQHGPDIYPSQYAQTTDPHYRGSRETIQTTAATPGTYGNIPTNDPSFDPDFDAYSGHVPQPLEPQQWPTNKQSGKGKGKGGKEKPTDVYNQVPPNEQSFVSTYDQYTGRHSQDDQLHVGQQQWPGDKKNKGKAKGKAKEVAQAFNEEVGGTPSLGEMVDPYQGADNPGGYSFYSNTYDAHGDTSTRDSTLRTTPRNANNPILSGDPNNYEDEDDPVLAQVLRQSKNIYQGIETGGEPSGSGIAGAYENVSLVEDLPTPLPPPGTYQKGSSRKNKATTANSLLESMYGNENWAMFQVENSWRYEFGAVFKVLFAEPMGQSQLSKHNKDPVMDADISEINRTTERVGNDVFYYGVRRFIVIDGPGGNGNSICVPIATYGRQGCLKKGIKTATHGIIYSKTPMALRGEGEFGVQPVRLVFDVELEGVEKLAKESRINYSKHVTIEHNARVCFIGYIDPEDRAAFADGVDRLWEQRRQARTKEASRDFKKHRHSHNR